MSTRRETTKQVFDTATEALDACQSWRHREGLFSALIPAAAPVSTQARSVQDRHPQLRGRSGPCAGAGAPLLRCARRALQQDTAVAAPPDPSHLSLITARWQNWRLKPLACLEQLPRHQRQSLLESPARGCEFGGEHWSGGPDPAPLSWDHRTDPLLIQSDSRVVSNWRCQVARRSDDVSPPSNQTPVRARDTAT